MQCIPNKPFMMASKEVIVDHLKERNERTLEVYAGDLKIIDEDGIMKLVLSFAHNTQVFPVREPFLFKLLKWFNLSHHNIAHFQKETLLAICNDNLKALSRKPSVYIKLENNEATSIVSSYFTSISDLEVIEIVSKNLDIDTISRDDFCMRIYTEIKSKAEPVVDDICGFGFNITNSETGFSTLKMEHYILRYWCTNGATMKIKKANMNIVHYGQNPKHIFQNLERVLMSAPKEPQGFIESVQKSLHQPAIFSFPTIDYKVSAIVGNSKGYSFFKQFNKKESNKYDLFNHITHTAKNFDILERYRLEQLAGELLN